MIYDQIMNRCICKTGYNLDKYSKCKKCIIYKDSCL